MKPQIVVNKDGSIKAVAKLKVKVTAKDIEQGDIDEPSSCAIALAVQRACGNAQVPVEVSGSGIEVGQYSRISGVKKALDKQLDKFVEAFDNLQLDVLDDYGDIVGEISQAQAAKKAGLKPFSFELELEKKLNVEVPALCQRSDFHAG